MRRQRDSRQKNIRNHKQNKRRQDKCGSGQHYQDLEPRQLLATTLYVDFGFGMATDFVVSDSDSQSLNGPEVFGSGYRLSSFVDSVIADQIDANGDEISDASDAPLVADQIIENLNRIFLPFDIDIQMANAASLTDIAASLNATTTNDAYVFVGGSEPSTMFDHGAAMIDVGNLEDNLAFVFAEETYEQFGTPDTESPHNTKFAHARNIAKQAAHTFGLDSVESGNYVRRTDWF